MEYVHVQNNHSTSPRYIQLAAMHAIARPQTWPPSEPVPGCGADADGVDGSRRDATLTLVRGTPTAASRSAPTASVSEVYLCSVLHNPCARNTAAVSLSI